MSPIAYIPRTREMYPDMPPYRWVVNDDAPWTPLNKPVDRCKVALLSSGGVHHADQRPFHYRDDTSIRRVPKGVRVEDLRVSHFGYRTEDAAADPNCVFPIERMRELEAEGVIGELANPAYTCMGGIYSTRRVRNELVPQVVDSVVGAGVDLLLLVPV